RRLVELAGLAWLLLAGAAQAQQGIQPYSPAPDTTPATQLRPISPPSQRTGIQLTQGGRPLAAPRVAHDEAGRSVILPLGPPTPKRLFRLESEQAWRQRIRQETLDRPYPDKVVFPDEPILTREAYAGRHWPKLHMVVEPYFVGYNPLYFQQLNMERYGWDLG